MHTLLCPHSGTEKQKCRPYHLKSSSVTQARTHCDPFLLSNPPTCRTGEPKVLAVYKLL